MMGEHGSQSDRIIPIAEKLDRAKEEDFRDKWKSVCIYRVPRIIKCRNPDLYEPNVVSFGPYHSSNPKVREADPHKWSALHYMLKRNNHEVAEYLDAVREWEQQARSCYEEEISLSSDEFVEMMVLDGCFLIECLLSQCYFKSTLGYPDNIPIFNVKEMIMEVLSDMLLVENQIPLFVLHTLAAKQWNPPVTKSLVYIKAISYFNMRIVGDYKASPSSLMGKEAFHILDMIMQLQAIDFDVSIFINDINNINNINDTNNNSNKNFEIPCASKLKEAGVKFVAGDQSWLIKFSKGTLIMPKLCFQSVSKKIIYNAVSYEQRHPGCDKVIIPYCIIMSDLIRSTKDVEYLIDAEIVQNLNENNDEVVKLFSEIEVTYDYSDKYLCAIANQINSHCNTPWNKWKAGFKDTYFSNPWVFISLLAATFIIILTFTQTFFTVFPRR